MKRSISKISKVLSAVVLTSLLVGAIVLALPAVVQAQSTNPPTPAAPAGQNQAVNQTVHLEKGYQAELKQVDAQAKRLSAVDTRVQNVANRIAKLKANGKDTTALDKALSDFKDMLAAAHTAHDSAAAILNTHAGFDANGKVTDIQAARDTVQQARRLFLQARQDLRPAVRDLVQAIRQYVRDNRKK